MLSDNKIYELGANNQVEFDNILKELAGDVDVPGFDEELLKTLMASAQEIDELISSPDKLNDVEPAKREKTPVITTEFNYPLSQKYADTDDSSEQRNSVQPKQILNDGHEIAEETFSDEQFDCTCPRCGFRFNR